MKKIYLAGPDVFLPNASAHGEQLKKIVADYGLEGLFPLDNEIKAGTPDKTAAEICNANIDMIKNCDGVIANLSPFRGPEPDSGTVWEVGFAQALGKTVVGYCTDGRTLKERTVDMLSINADSEYDKNGMAIEDFGLTHNLMYAGIVTCRTFEEAVEKIRESLMK